VVEASSLDAEYDESSGQPAESATQLHNGGKTKRVGAAGRPAPRGQRPCNRVEDVYVARVAAGADRVPTTTVSSGAQASSASLGSSSSRT